MPFHLSNSLQYSSNKNNLEKKLFIKNQQSFCYNKNYLFERQINSQYRQDKRRSEYESIQKENLKFSQRLINAKAFFNRYEHQLFFDKHCKIKQRLQRYPDSNRTKTNRSDFQLKVSHDDDFKNINKSEDSSFLIYNDNRTSRQAIKPREKHSKMDKQVLISKDPLCYINKPQTTQKKLSHNSQSLKTLPPITLTQKTNLLTKTVDVPNIETDLFKNESSLIRTTNTSHWNILTNTENVKQISTSKSNLLI